MGVDCNIYAMPKGRLPRSEYLDRYYVSFQDVMMLLGQDSFGWKPVPAYQMFVAIENAPQTAFEDYLDYVRHWRGKALEFVSDAMDRFGPDTPVIIIPEDRWDRRSFAGLLDADTKKAMERLVELKDAKKARERAMEEAENARVYEQVKSELRAKIARQWEEREP